MKDLKKIGINEKYIRRAYFYLGIGLGAAISTTWLISSEIVSETDSFLMTLLYVISLFLLFILIDRSWEVIKLLNKRLK